MGLHAITANRDSQLISESLISDTERQPTERQPIQKKNETSVNALDLANNGSRRSLHEWMWIFRVRNSFVRAVCHGRGDTARAGTLSSGACALSASSRVSRVSSSASASKSEVPVRSFCSRSFFVEARRQAERRSAGTNSACRASARVFIATAHVSA